MARRKATKTAASAGTWRSTTRTPFGPAGVVVAEEHVSKAYRENGVFVPVEAEEPAPEPAPSEPALAEEQGASEDGL